MTARLIIPLAKAASLPSEIVGEKGVELSQLLRAGFPVPEGLVISAEIFELLLDERLKKVVESRLAGLSSRDPLALKRASATLQQLLETAPLDDELLDIFSQTFQAFEGHFVAVRASRSHPQLPHTHATHLNLQGETSILHALRQTWSSVLDPIHLRAILDHQLPLNQIRLSVVIQLMVQSQVAGEMWTTPPQTGSKRHLLIQAVHGNGEYLGSHRTQADEYEIEKDTLTLTRRLIRPQHALEVRTAGGMEVKNLSEVAQYQPKLNPQQLEDLAKLGLAIQQKLFFPQRIEWAISDRRVYVLQTQPVALEEQPRSVSNTQPHHPSSLRSLRATPINPGKVSGRIVFLERPPQHRLPAESIVVLPALNEEFLPYVQHCIGIIIESSEYPQSLLKLPLPSIANATSVRSMFPHGQWVTLEANNGWVTAEDSSRSLDPSPPIHPLPQLMIATSASQSIRTLPTTIDGIGIFRAEPLVCEVGVHPKFLLRQRKQEQIINHLVSSITQAAARVPHGPIVYRSFDFTSDQLASLKHGDEFEQLEPNPALGYRGAYRALTDPELFQLELEAFQRAARTLGNRLQLMIPFIRSRDEWLHITQLLEKKFPTLPKLWLMVDTPSVALTLNDYLTEHVVGICIGARDLIMLLSGLDPTLDRSALFSTHLDPAFLSIVRQIVKVGKNAGIPVMFYDHELSQQLIEELVTMEIDILTVDVEQLEFTKHQLQRIT